MRPILLGALFSLALPAAVHAAENADVVFDATFPRLTTSTAAEEPVPFAPASTFEKGTWAGQVFLSGTHGFDDGDIYLIHAGVGYHLLDDLSINLDFIGGYTFEDQRRVDPNATVGFDLMLRLHLFKGTGWSIFVEGGAGMVWFRDHFPPGGTHQNFTPQLGAGITFPFFAQSRLLVGIRWHHISNAGKTGEGRNPGYDGIMAYAGVMIPF